MTGSHVVVTTGLRNEDRLPDYAVQYALIVAGLGFRGVLADVLERLRVRRKRGYVGLDAFLFLLLYFTAKLDGGFKGLTEVSKPWAKKLGAIAGRRRLMTQQSLSRLFKRVEESHVGANFMQWLLVDAADCGEFLSAPATATFDSQGQRWRFFDFDGTLLALRRRGLPEYIELPDPERLVDDSYAVEGYAGRKRADLQMCRETLQDAGSGLWLGLWCAPGNGDKSRSVPEAAKLAASVMRDLDEPDRGVMRFDGAYGSWQVIEDCAKEGVGHLVRWRHYEILNTREVAALCERGSWERVRDSRSGPTRFAIDLGELYSPDRQHRTRLVCSRYCDETGAGVGCPLDGWRYEIFVTSLPAGNWSAAQVVTAYYGRVGQENRFAQEDNELRLDSIFSKNLPAQALATIVGLFVWNLQTIAGWQLSNAEIPELPPQPRREVELQSDEVPHRQPHPLVNLLENSVDWSTTLPSGWWWEPRHGLRCPGSIQMYLKGVRSRSLIFRAPPGACRGCAVRVQCTDSTLERYRRELQVKARPGIKEQIQTLKRRGLRSAMPHSLGPDKTKEVTDQWTAPLTVEDGPFEAVGPYLIPSELRHDFRRASALEATIHASYRPRSRSSRHLALTNARRQRRRLTWAERNAWNALPDDAAVRVLFAGWQELDVRRALASTGVRGSQHMKIAA